MTKFFYTRQPIKVLRPEEPRSKFGLFHKDRSKIGQKCLYNKVSERDTNWRHRFALISHDILLKMFTFNFYMDKSLRKYFWIIISFLGGFWTKISLRNLFFGLPSREMFFFNLLLKCFTIQNSSI